MRTVERDLEDEFSRIGRVEKVVIVWDARVSKERLETLVGATAHIVLMVCPSLIALEDSDSSPCLMYQKLKSVSVI